MLRIFQNLQEPKKLWRILILLGLSLLVVIIFAQKIEFSAVDLGRHLENGRLVFQHKDLLFKNFYSYTEPDQSFINHHWLAGVIFYAVYLVGGFNLLSVFNILLALAVFLCFFKLAYKRAGFYLPVILSVPVILLFSERVEIRPEIFSYLFLAITWLIWESERFSTKRKMLILVPLFIIWANIHIYFFLGLALLGFKLAEKFLWQTFDGSDNSLKIKAKTAFFKIKKDFLNLLLLVAVCFLTPNTWRGFFYPFNILKNYGYEIAENKSIFYLQNLMLNYNFNIFKLLLVVLGLSLIATWFFYKKPRWFEIFLGIFMAALALFASRNLALFGLVSLVLISYSLKKPLVLLWSRIIPSHYEFPEKLKKYSLLLPGLLILGVMFFLINDYDGHNNFLKGDFGLGLSAGQEDSFQFFKNSGLTGPMFNNYDDGSALIFGLDNKEQVFVDNRPEAYSPKFFTGTYLPMQNDATQWQNVLAQYNFKTVYFSYTDQTPWGQTFLKRILADSDWQLVYFDRQYVILARKSVTDPVILNKYTIDDWAFRNRLRDLTKTSSVREQFYLASLAQSYGMSDLAEEIYRQILLSNSKNQKAIFSFAYLYSASSDRNTLLKAVDYFQRGLKIENKTPSVYSGLAMVYWNLGDYVQAEANWHQALKINRHDTDALYYLAQVEDLKKRGLLPR
jgi:tetratricopeptide (TPR) repeat protein